MEGFPSKPFVRYTWKHQETESNKVYTPLVPPFRYGYACCCCHGAASLPLMFRPPSTTMLIAHSPQPRHAKTEPLQKEPPNCSWMYTTSNLKPPPRTAVPPSQLCLPHTPQYRSHFVKQFTSDSVRILDFHGKVAGSKESFDVQPQHHNNLFLSYKYITTLTVDNCRRCLQLILEWLEHSTINCISDAQCQLMWSLNWTVVIIWHPLLDQWIVKVQQSLLYIPWRQLVTANQVVALIWLATCVRCQGLAIYMESQKKEHCGKQFRSSDNPSYL